MSNLERLFFEGGIEPYAGEQGERLFEAWQFPYRAVAVEIDGTERKHPSALWVPGRINRHGEALTMLAIPDEAVAAFADESRIIFHASYFYGVLERLPAEHKVDPKQAFSAATREFNAGATDNPFQDMCSVLMKFIDQPEA